MTEERKAAKWVITLGGGDWNTVKYGMVEYLRSHPKARVGTAVLGLVWIVGWLISVAGFKWQNSVLPTVSTVFVTPILLWMAVVSGPDFELKFGETKSPPKNESSQPDPKGPIDPEGFGVEALNRTYSSLEAYARSSFRWALFSALTGVGFAMGGEWLSINGTGKFQPSHIFPFVWMLSATCLLLGIVLVFRAIIIFRRAAAIHDKLLDLQRTIIAVKLAQKSKQAQSVIESPNGSLALPTPTEAAESNVD